MTSSRCCRCRRLSRCAEALAQAYAASFPAGASATLSAAVVFAHVRLPLRAALDEGAAPPR
ncbi:MAG: hypothetical protein IPK71_11945 [Myxococcales bacterium]|nr:hypothetical protein [Myxococcales bacterium]